MTASRIKKSISTLFLVIVLLPNALAQSTKHNGSRGLTKVFTTSEINQLELLQTFFESQICTIDSITVEKCYAQYISSILKDTISGELDFNISFGKQQKIYEQLDSSLINEIWWFGEMRMSDTVGVFKYISLKRSGKYADFLKLLGKRDKIMWEYQRSALGEDFYAPSFVTGMVQTPTAFELSNPNVRLVLAIHFLTLNDFVNRMESF